MERKWKHKTFRKDHTETTNLWLKLLNRAGHRNKGQREREREYKSRGTSVWWCMVAINEKANKNWTLKIENSKTRGAHISGSRSPHRLCFVQWCLIFVHPQYGTYLMSTFLYLQFWGGGCILGSLCTPGKGSLEKLYGPERHSLWHNGQRKTRIN